MIENRNGPVCVPKICAARPFRHHACFDHGRSELAVYSDVLSDPRLIVRPFHNDLATRCQIISERKLYAFAAVICGIVSAQQLEVVRSRRHRFVGNYNCLWRVELQPVNNVLHQHGHDVFVVFNAMIYDRPHDAVIGRASGTIHRKISPDRIEDFAVTHFDILFDFCPRFATTCKDRDNCFEAC